MNQMQDELEARLSQMKVRELKELAKEKNINLSKCRTKNDYIARIIQHEAVQHSELIHEEEFAVDGDEMVELDERLNSLRNGSVEFSNVVDVQKQMERMIKSRQFTEIVAQVETSMSKGEASFKRFQVIGLSLAILSSEKYIESIRAMGIEVKEPENLLLEAKRRFNRGAYDDTGNTVVKIRDLTVKLHSERSDKLHERLQSLSTRIRDAHDIGAHMEKAELIMKDANKAYSDGRFVDCASYVERVETAIGDAWAQRIDLIRETIDFVAGLITDAESIGGNVTEAKKKLDYSRELFDSEEFQKCMQETIGAEKAATELIRTQAQRAQTLLKSLEDRYKVASTNVPLRQAKATTSVAEIGIVELKQSCPGCGKPLSFIEKYNRWYCYSCEQYV